VILDYDWRDADLSHLLAHDSDPFNRWEAGQRLASRLILAAAEDLAAGRPAHWPQSFAAARAGSAARRADPAFAAEVLTLPGEATLAEEMAVVDPDALHAARNGLRRFLAERLHDELRQCYESLAPDGPYQPTPAPPAGAHCATSAWATSANSMTPRCDQLAMRQFASADNMSDQFAALATLAQHDCQRTHQALAAFYERWHGEALVVDKWLSVQASSRLPDTLAVVGACSPPGVRPAQSEQGLRADQHLRQQPRPLSCRRRQWLPLPRRADRPIDASTRRLPRA
jgi:aminopeptidase N